MKLTRSTYVMVFAILLFMNIRITIKQFSEEIERQLYFPTLILFVILIGLGIILSIKDNEFIHIISDERTKKVDRAAGYYSWWFTVLFAWIYGSIAYFMKLSLNQYVFVLITVMLVTMFVFHLYLNFKGDI
jgi:hypothetical protein